MSRNLQLQVILNAVDRVTRPLKQIQRGSGQTAQALRSSRDQLRQLEGAQKNLTGFANLKRTSEGTARSLQQQQQRVRELTQQIRQTEGPTRQLNRQREAAIRQARQLKDRYQQEQQQLQTLRGRLRDVDGVTGSYSQQQRQLTERIRAANQQMQTQQQRLGRIAERQRLAAAAAERHQRAMGNVGRMAGVGAGMMGGGMAKGYAASRMLAPGVSWAEQMATIQAVGRFDGDDERYLGLRAQSRELGGSTAFSATEVGAGQEFLLRAGMSAEAIRSSMRDVLDLALANNTELGKTADIASNIAGAFKIDMEIEGAMGRVADVLSGTATRANVDLEMLGDTMKYLGGAEDLNLTLEQGAAMAGLLGNIGIQGSQAGTTMRAMMNRLTNPAAKGASAIEQISLAVADADGNMRPMPDILRDIQSATESLGNVERKAILQDIFGAEAGSGMAELVSQMADGSLDTLIQELGDGYGENARMAATMADSISGDLKNLRSAWEEVGISVTDTNDGPLRDLVQTVTSMLRGLGDWIKANPQLVGTLSKVIGALIVLTTVGGALTMMLASVLGPIVMARYALQLMAIHGAFLAKTALPAVLAAFKALGAALLAHPVIAIVAALAAGALYVWRNWETIGPKFAALWQSLREGLGAAWEGIKAAFEGGIGGVTRLLLNWSPLGILWRGISAALGALGIELPATLTGLGGAIIDGIITGITGALGRLREAVTNIGGNIMGWFKDRLGINSPSKVFAGFGGNLLEGLMDGIDEKWSLLKDKISNVAGGVVGWFKDRLGINSPSKVFAEFGVNTMEGYQVGIERAESEPLREVGRFASRMRQAGAGLLLGGAAMGASADGIQFDASAPLPAAASGGLTIHGGINVSVSAAPGMNEGALAQLVAREVERALQQAERRSAARSRSAFHDLD
jgi:TP901 family phage tail tape measure protein